jgi:hypothetical protein
VAGSVIVVVAADTNDKESIVMVLHGHTSVWLNFGAFEAPTAIAQKFERPLSEFHEN